MLMTAYSPIQRSYRGMVERATVDYRMRYRCNKCVGLEVPFSIFIFGRFFRAMSSLSLVFLKLMLTCKIAQIPNLKGVMVGLNCWIQSLNTMTLFGR